MCTRMVAIQAAEADVSAPLSLMTYQQHKAKGRPLTGLPFLSLCAHTRTAEMILEIMPLEHMT